MFRPPPSFWAPHLLFFLPFFSSSFRLFFFPSYHPFSSKHDSDPFLFLLCLFHSLLFLIISITVIILIFIYCNVVHLFPSFSKLSTTKLVVIFFLSPLSFIISITVLPSFFIIVEFLTKKGETSISGRRNSALADPDSLVFLYPILFYGCFSTPYISSSLDFLFVLVPSSSSSILFSLPIFLFSLSMTLNLPLCSGYTGCFDDPGRVWSGPESSWYSGTRSRSRVG